MSETTSPPAEASPPVIDVEQLAVEVAKDPPANNLLEAMRAQEPTKRIDPRLQQLHRALQLSRGDREKASVIMGCSKRDITHMINRCAWLNERWKVRPYRKIGEGKKLPSPGERSEADKIVAEASSGMLDYAKRVRQVENHTDQLDAINKQIAIIEARLADPTNLKWNTKGEPVEERMLRESLDRMIIARQKVLDGDPRILWTLAKVAHILNGAKAGGKGPNGRRPGFKPKGETVVNVFTPNANVTVPEPHK